MSKKRISENDHDLDRCGDELAKLVKKASLTPAVAEAIIGWMLLKNAYKGRVWERLNKHVSDNVTKMSSSDKQAAYAILTEIGSNVRMINE
jgi:hypothetical protein